MQEPLLPNAKRLAATEHRTAGAFLPSPPPLLQLLWKSWLLWQAGAAGTEQGQVAPGEQRSSLLGASAAVLCQGAALSVSSDGTETLQGDFFPEDYSICPSILPLYQ